MNNYQIRRLVFGPWAWSCAVCHHDDNIPWCEVGSYNDAWDAVDAHNELHLVTGKRLEWAPVRS